MTQLSPLDLLSLSSLEQDVVRYLLKRPRQTARQIATATAIPVADLEATLTALVETSRLAQCKANGEATFEVLFKKRKASADNGLLSSLFG